MFPIVNVPAEGGTSIEQLGTKEKFWYDDKSLGPCLCKIARPFTGEDWSEKVSAELCLLLGLPHARYELAEWRETPCVVSPYFIPPEGTLVLGNELLVQVDPLYLTTSVTRFKQKRHTVAAACGAIRQSACNVPFGWHPPPGVAEATDVFAGYLLLDTLVGNTDRHHENWGLVHVQSSPSLLYLAPTFDHASSLGCHELDIVRAARLKTADAQYNVAAYCRRARSAFYGAAEDAKSLAPLDAFEQCARMATGARQWLSKIEELRPPDIENIFNQVPRSRMSEPARLFAMEMLRCNKEILLRLAETL